MVLLHLGALGLYALSVYGVTQGLEALVAGEDAIAELTVGLRAGQGASGARNRSGPTAIRDRADGTDDAK